MNNSGYSEKEWKFGLYSLGYHIMNPYHCDTDSVYSSDG